MQQYDRAYFGNTTVQFQNTTVCFPEYDRAVSGIRLGMSQECCEMSRDVARMSWNVVRMSQECRENVAGMS